MTAFPAAPRLHLVVELSARCLLEEDVRAFPVAPAEIIRRRGWRLRTYTHMARRMSDSATIGDVAAMYAAQDAFTSRHVPRGQAAAYLICYNDQIDVPERTSFSLAHEIGHILLEHFDFGSQEELTPAQRRLLDQEANAFAANLLAPAAIIARMRRPCREADRLLFGLSKAGWQTRLSTLAQDGALLAEDTAARLRSQFAGYMYRRRCVRCGAIFTGRDACPGCGGQELRWSPANACDGAFPWPDDAWTIRAASDPAMLENPLADDALWHGDDRGSY